MTTYSVEQNQNAPGSISLIDIIKAFNGATGTEFATRMSDLNTLLSSTINPEWENITGDPYDNAELGEILTYLVKQTLLNTLEIQYQHKLNGLLILELIDQGVKIESKELLNELNYIKRNGI